MAASARWYSTDPVRVVFIGPPGAGKGTQCKRLSNELEIPHISSGEMLRATKSDSSIGDLIAGYIDGGHLAPDDLIMQLMIERLRQPDCNSGYLLDGFPRTVNQAQMLDDYLAERNQQVDRVINLVADEHELVSRLLARAQTESRADDTIETIRSRLVIFRERTQPVLEFYQRQAIVHDVDAMQKPEEVFETIRATLV